MDTNNFVSLSTHLKMIASNWTSYTLLGSFILYLTGYLSLRFHMSVFGLGTDISVFDERYFFTGVNFFIYIISSIPILILIGIIVYFPIKIIIKLFKRFIDSFFPSWTIDAHFILLIGIVCSTIFIQFFMRKCFLLTNVLVSNNIEQIEKEKWLIHILNQDDLFWSNFYFPLLLIGLILSFIIWWNIQKTVSSSQEFFWFKHLLSFLIVSQFLFLPINYGALIMSQTAPRVATPKVLKNNQDKLEFWLVWEGEKGVTYLKRNLLKKDEKSLLTLNKKDVNHEEILCYDNLLKIILNKEKSCISN